MKKKFRSLFVLATSTLLLTSCRSEITASEAKTIADGYTTSAATEKYSSGTATISYKINKATGIFEDEDNSLFEYSDETETEAVAITPITSTEITTLSTAFSDLTFYKDGKGLAMTYTYDFTSTLTASVRLAQVLAEKTNEVEKAAMDYDVSYNDYGLLSKAEIVVEVEITGDGDLAGALKYTATTTVSYTEK